MPEVTAVFVASDEMAFGLIAAVKELGRRVPEDISVVGIDDIELAPYCAPPLTTVRQPLEEIGRQAVRQLDGELSEHGDTPVLQPSRSNRSGIDPALKHRQTLN